MTINEQLAKLTGVTDKVESESVRRLFDHTSNNTPDKLLEALAAYAASDDGFSERNKSLIDDLAHLLADDQDLLSRPYIEKRRTAELAIELFIVAGYITKAATLARAYRRATGKLYSLHSSGSAELLTVALSRELLWSLLTQDPAAILEIVDALGSAARDNLTAPDEARYLSVAQSIAHAMHDVLFRARPSFSKQVLDARAELLVELAVLTRQARLLRTAKSLAAVVNHVSRYATSYTLGNGNGALTQRMLEALYGEAAESRVPLLWPPQQSALANGLLSAPYYVVSAPTSSGKTFLAELKISMFLDRKPDGLAVYVAPYNALAKQVGDAMTKRFRTAGIPPAIVWTGTYEIDSREIGSAAVLVTTPEKLDGIVRSASEGNIAGLELLRRAGLFIFDELHLIASHNRG
ncbi:MAG: ATP-dependent helicase, partial [Candidatus Eremiobacteraeota bacterium]|nr:ATP-dependent helicase [Candidatus Eremiobacteraeota bacterium]